MLRLLSVLFSIKEVLTLLSATQGSRVSIFTMMDSFDLLFSGKLNLDIWFYPLLSAFSLFIYLSLSIKLKIKTVKIAKVLLMFRIVDCLIFLAMAGSLLIKSAQNPISNDTSINILSLTMNVFLLLMFTIPLMLNGIFLLNLRRWLHKTQKLQKV